MDKSQWPQAWKDQYNREIKKRECAKHAREAKDRILDLIYFPRMNEMDIDEESIFALMAYRFPFGSIISRVFQKFIAADKMKELILSPRYLHSKRKMFPGYYSDRERIITMMNRYRVSGNVNDFVHWAEFQSEKATFHYIDFMIGTISLDYYTESPRNKNDCLEISLKHLERASEFFEREESKLVANYLVAFAYYLNRDFDRSMKHLNSNKTNFENDFIELIKKVA